MFCLMLTGESGMLSMLGLDATAEAVYRAMLAHPQDGTAALRQRLSLSDESVRQALDTLSELALLRPAHGRQGELRAVSPDVGMEILIARQQAELAAQQLRVEASRAAAAELIAEFAESRPTGGAETDVERLVGMDQIRDRLASLTRQVRHEVMTFAPGGAHSPEDIAAAKPLNRQLRERGVQLRTVYLDSIRNSPATVEYVNWLTRQGGQVRTTPTLPTRMIITDRTSAVIPVRTDDTGVGAVVLTGEGTLTALCALFESVWGSASPLGEEAPKRTDGLSAQEATAIRLLADGLTDEAVAKRLGVSHRTARRLATELMERLGARSRFEAGVRAVQQGWLPHSV